MPNDLFYESAREQDQAERGEQLQREAEEIDRATAYIARQQRLAAWDEAIREGIERSRKEVRVA